MLLSFVLAGCSRSPIETGIKSTLEETLDDYLSANVDDTSPGTAILVLKDGEVVYMKGGGSANIAQGISITPNTGFRIASVSKTFTAVAVMQLYERELVVLNESILTYLPELPISWQKITVHHLLTHQSGIPDYLNDLGIERWPEVVHNSDLIAYFTENSALEFRPGAASDYSNMGYVILSEIISRISGLTFADYMDQYVFRLAGMKDSYILDDNSKRRATDSLHNGTSETIFGKHWNTSGEDGQISSIQDFRLFLQALFEWKLISEESFDLMKYSHTIDLSPGTNYGYGLGSDSNIPPNLYSHVGTMGNFTATFTLYNTTDSQLVILSNGSGTDHRYIRELIDHF